MRLSNRIGQIWILAVISVTMIGYQNCAQNAPQDATLNSQGNPTPPPSDPPSPPPPPPPPPPAPSVFSTLTGTSSTGHDWVYSVAQGGDLSVYYAGTAQLNTGNTASRDGSITKMDGNGNIMWSKTYGGAKQDQFFSIIVSSDGNLIVVGTSASFAPSSANDNDGIMMKIAPDGSLIWARNYRGAGNEEFYAVKEIPGGGYAVVGKTSGATAADENAIVMRTDSNGAEIWVRNFGGTKADRFTSLFVTEEGGLLKILAGGYTQSFGAAFAGVDQREGLLIKLNDAGSLHWARILGGTIEDRVNGITDSADHQSYIIALKTDLAASSGSDTVIAKLGLNGATVKAAGIATNNFDEPFEVVRTMDGSYAVASLTGNAIDVANITNYNPRLTKISANLDSVIWHREYGKSGKEESYFHPMIERKDGGFAIGTSSTSYGSTYDAMLIQTDEGGRINSPVTCMEVQSPTQALTAASFTNATQTLTLNTTLAVTRSTVTPSVANLGVSQLNACIP